jgi:ankyrin repeat protein
VTALLERQARPDERDAVGWTPLHHAAAENKVAVARSLLAGGANPHALSERGGTPLHEAAASGGAEMIRLLLDAGVDPAVVSKTGVTALQIAREFKNEAAIAELSTRAGGAP